MEMESYQHGVPSWADLGTPDIGAATRFYTGLFGWDVQAGPPEAGGYSIAHLRGKTVVGLAPQMQPGPSFWTPYVNVDSADAVATLASANGGAVHVAPFDVMDVGRMAILADPVGAVFGAWQPRAHKGAQLIGEPGAMTWIELNTTDVAGAVKFYGAVFGWTATTHAGGVPYTEFAAGGQSIAGMMPRPAEMPAEVPSHWLVYFAVTDADATADQAKKGGGALLAGPMDIEPGRFAVVADPGGAPFGIIAMRGH